MDGVRDNANECPGRTAFLPNEANDASGPNDGEATHSALGTLHAAGESGAGGERAEHSSRTWRQELPRWLASLDSERTRREYEKAVGYFFRIPGVPESLEGLTFDLLLAYRGSLALRAERTYTASGHGQAMGQPGAARIAGESNATQETPRLTAGTDAPSDDSAPPEEPIEHHAGASPLAPATVNIRLTALRQFLAHCSLWGFLPDLSPDRMRAALRRLRIERRRPYQILAEPEWADFLRAALAPGAALEPVVSHREPRAPYADPLVEVAERASGAASETPTAGMIASDGTLVGRWWGVPRAERTRLEVMSSPQQQRPARARAFPRRPRLPRSPAGLTGVHTAQRDHALLALALATGLRAIELCSLDLGDLTREWTAGREEWWLVLPDAKTKGQHGGRTLPLAPALAATLLEYATATGRQWARTADRATPLFLSRHGAERKAQGTQYRPARAARGRLSPQQVRRIVDRVERQWITALQGGHQGAEDANDRAAETRAISPHALRHSTAVALLEGNEHSGRAPASVEHVRGWLGHFDIRTTQGYLAHLDARRHRRPFVLQPVEEIFAPQHDTQHDRRHENLDPAPGSGPPSE